MKLGPHEILAVIGAGGMGEVYRARDTRLDRTVAIKILPAHLSQNAGARERLDREARTISSLSDPNICHLYDVGQQDDVRYLVIEYLEGESRFTLALPSFLQRLSLANYFDKRSYPPAILRHNPTLTYSRKATG